MTAKAGIEVDLLEGGTCQTQVEQHAFMLWAVLRHSINQLEVHVGANTLGSIFLEFVDCTNDLRLDRALGGECLDDGLGLEPYCGFSQEGRENTAGPSPRLGALFILHAKNLEALDIHIYPVFSGGDVGLNLGNQIRAELLKLALVHEFS